jgi:hypothetical protein
VLLVPRGLILFAKYNLNDQVKENKWAGHIARMDAKRNAYRILVGKSEGMRPLGRPRRKWKNTIKMNLK